MKFRVIGIGILGGIVGLFLSLIFRMPFSKDLIYDLGPISCVLPFLALRCGGILLLLYTTACWVFAKFGRRHHLLIRMPIHRGIFLSVLLYSTISSALIPEISPLQIFMEHQPSITVLHPGFSRLRFSKVKCGMTRGEVKQLIGEGFTEDMHLSSENYSAWAYSRKGFSDNYWIYHVVFDDKGNVSDRYMLYWFD